MELNERQQEIFDLICERGKMTVSELSKTFFVTEMTVRRDLIVMENAGYIKRFRGGAMEIPQTDAFPLSKRILIDEDEKRLLGRRAADFLQDDICIFIDSSSTTSFIIPYIKKFKNVKVFTNSTNALILLSKLGIEVFLIGGEYNEHDMCCIGPAAEQSADKINVDVAFVSTFGISADGFITDSTPCVTAVKERIIKNATQTVFMFEKSKIGKKGLYTLCHKEDENVTVLLSSDQ